MSRAHFIHRVFVDWDAVPRDSFVRVIPALASLPLDLVLAGNAMRTAAEQVGSLVGAVYSEDLLDNLFSRFCVGK